MRLDPSSPSVGTQRAAMTLPSLHSRGKREKIGVFDYTDEDEHVEEMSKKLLRKFDSPGTTSKPPRALDKYDFLRFFSVTQGTQGESKALNHRVIDVEVPAKEERLRCEPSGYNKACDLIDVPSDDSHGRIGVNSSSSSENDDASKGEEATSIISGSREVDSENSHVLIIPDFIIYGDIYCTNSKLTFSRNCMSVESSSVNATKGTFSCKWAIEDIVRIESQWCSELETAVVNVLLKSRDPNKVDNAKKISGIDLLKFSVYDAKSFKEVETIKLLDSRYKDIWFDTITESEESACSGHNLETSLTNLAGSFEDLVYPQGEPDAVVVRKQDIELLKPRRFINDTIIDFYIKYLKSRIPPEERGRFHFFNCFFFRKLANLDKGSPSSFGGREAYQRVQKWTKNVELFEKDYIFIPINFSFHWSLIIICHPSELVPSSVENPSRVPCILHLDSIKGSHKGGLVNIFPSYLREEWKARQGNTTTDLSRASNMQLISLELPQQENSFDCGLFLLHYLELFVTRAPAKFNPSLITRSGKFLTRKWFPAKEASLKRGYILELLYNLHKGHDPSILPANCNSKQPHFRVSNKNDEENESKNVTETCKWRKPFDGGSSSIVTYIPQTMTCLPDQILSKEVFYAGGYDLPEASKRRKSFMSPIVEEVQESGEKEEIHLPMDTEESICQEMETLRKEECMLYIEDTDDDEAVSVEYVPDSQDSYEVEMKEAEEEDDELILFTGASKEIHKTRETKSASAWIEKGVHKSKSRALAARSCCNNILLVLSDDEGSSAGSYELQNKENISSSSCNVMAKRPKT
ncbi:Cysteine proteinases superfamily protein [Raphanus sativus]|uniref:Probable ubiquitin-like-specific protease 2A n=1 Tax=Raphanus sativus TaxID=3726 RepID=A0A6J0M6N1_RAPSA|nr:probable ubiquitin-like-specific protease 2A [Raphanus sativus]KAJ4873529.1 Cysteine proteinases superfamily protein [Raphanus sativus]